MTVQVLLDDDAWRDYEDVEAYFIEKDLSRLIPRFQEDLFDTLRFIGENPLLRAEVRPGVRHERLRVFKHHVWYRVFEEIEHVEVFAILHDARGPEAIEPRL